MTWHRQEIIRAVDAGLSQAKCQHAAGECPRCNPVAYAVHAKHRAWTVDLHPTLAEVEAMFGAGAS